MQGRGVEREIRKEEGAIRAQNTQKEWALSDQIQVLLPLLSYV